MFDRDHALGLSMVARPGRARMGNRFKFELPLRCAGHLWPRPPGIRFNKHIEADGPTFFAHACKDGARSHRLVPDWLKMKNSECTGSDTGG
jgi:hypothetical protein